MPINTVTADQSTGLLKTANNLSEIRAYTDQLFAVGDIKLMPGNTAPKGWLLCNGASVSTTTYAALFTRIAYSFGGSGASFTLPNITAPSSGGTTSYIIKATEYTP
jgi:microcystin-dependent protein